MSAIGDFKLDIASSIRVLIEFVLLLVINTLMSILVAVADYSQGNITSFPPNIWATKPHAAMQTHDLL